MATVTLSLNTKQLEKLREDYTPFHKEKVPQYALFQAKKNDVTITAYLSGKVVFQGHGADREASRWQNLFKKSASSLSTDPALPQGFSTWSVLGSDEVGNGSYFGPLVVAAAYVDKDQHDLIKELGVQDSKNLTDQRIQYIAQDLKLTIPYKLLVVNPEKYNHIQPQMNQNKMKAVLHNQALNFVLKQIEPQKPEAILVDQFEPAKAYFNHIKDQPHPLQEGVHFAKKGESKHLAVAAASILARDQFLKELDRLSDLAGFAIPSGAGPASDRVASRIIKSPQLDLDKFAKLHFANTKKAKKLADK